MNKVPQHVLDGKAALGTAGTMLGGMSSKIEAVEPIVGLFFTVLVGTITVMYTWERYRKLRRERKKDEGDK